MIPRGGSGIAVLTITILAVTFRAAVFVFWEQAQFDSDQAVVGLMTKHLAEGRALPLFHYGLDYILMLQPWVTVPFFWVLGPSVASLKLPLLLGNIAVACGLLVFLSRDARLSPWLALIAASWFVLPAPMAAAELVTSPGATFEPFVFILLLWILRERPAWFGVVAAVGILNRPFVLYGVAAIVVIRLIQRRSDRLGWWIGSVLLAGAVLWDGLVLASLWSSPLGPGTASWRTAAAAPLSAGSAGFVYWDADVSRIATNLHGLVSSFMPDLFGARAAAVSEANIRGASWQGVDGLWPVLCLAGAFVAIRLGCLVGRRRPHERGWEFCLYLTLVGAQALLTFALTRYDPPHVLQMRHGLLGLLLPVGLSGLYFAVEDRTALRRVAVGLALLVAAVAGAAHARLLGEYLTTPPPADHRMLAERLTSGGVRYALANYWDAYHVTFLANERVIVASEPPVRIREYQDLVQANAGEAVYISRQPCPGAEQVRGWYLCAM